ncbi:CTP synthase [Spirochaeta lutea]|uniref:CTP synthase n=1 Tax=Spirochaeta lutea TaxID=1480694 RepID=A0A098QWF9_9SPIO|nr:CTP synthase [Spirochaeta lutea]KGE71881.1 CTP synthetase [Spirochaeta lutea]
MKKYIFVTGGVCSSLGKGIAAASVGSLLEARGLVVRMVKIDPYINVDAGTMSPYQHGEVFVTDDGAETDLDLGNYSRFTNSTLSRQNSITTGQVYQEVIQREREGRYLGRTVQVIPHITDRIKQRILAVGEEAEVDVTIIEVGGTVGDIESIPFLEAARQMIHEIGHENALSLHLTLIPEVAGGELKTKPTQHSVNKMREIGIQPDMLFCRAPHVLEDDMRRKIALFTNVHFDAVISAHDVSRTIYEIPLSYQKQKVDQIILHRLGIQAPEADMSHWNNYVTTYTNAQRVITIGMIGKYIELADSYKSVDEALLHAGVANGVRVEIEKIDSEELEKLYAAGGMDALGDRLGHLEGVLVPGGFGSRGIPGMVLTARYCRERGLPYFGICLGMQIMVIEWARDVLDWEDANSTEFAPDCKFPVVSLLEEQIDVKNYGGTMRLGRNDSYLHEGTTIASIYGAPVIAERHRHRYEVSNKVRADLERSGLLITATTKDGDLVESVQWPNHSWGLGVQYHPEFLSKPLKSHPLFTSFIEAAKRSTPIEAGKNGSNPEAANHSTDS